jgi:hypothetical protein
MSVDLKARELNRAITFIAAVGCKYKIITPDGQEFGELETVKDKTRPHFDYGTFRKHYKPQLNMDAVIGEIQFIDCGGFEPERIRSGLCAYLTTNWGVGTYVTAIKENIIEILRVA